MAETTRNGGCGCLPALFLLLLGVVAIEFVGQKYLFANKLYFVNDVDHRLSPDIAENNADGIRSAREAADFRPGDENVIFLGDSFVHGLLVKPEESIPAQFERIANEEGATAPAVRAANFGWVSSSPLLSLRLLRDIGAGYS
ncbi:MAG: hypothetical protein HKN20_07645, partial [Gemmatimonadetes bacterium]|nr:hypothetical protein [Gemmatimonadota bacterium]